MLEEIKTDVDRLLLVLEIKKKVQFHQNISKNLFSSSKSKVIYLPPFLSSLLFQKNLKTTFYMYNIWTQTCRNWAKLFTSTCYFSQVSHALKLLENYRNVYRKSSANIMLRMCYVTPIEPSLSRKI